MEKTKHRSGGHAAARFVGGGTGLPDTGTIQEIEFGRVVEANQVVALVKAENLSLGKYISRRRSPRPVANDG